MDIEELKKLRQSYISTRNTYLIIAGIIFAVFIAFSIMIGIPQLFFFGLVVLFIIYVIIVGSKKQKFVGEYKKVVMPLALQQVMTDAIFDEKYSGILNYVEGRIISRGNKRHCGDYVKGNYKGINVELSEMYIAYETTDSDGNTDTTVYFSGVWFIFDFNKTFKDNLLVHSKNYGYAVRFGEKIDTEDVDFNNKFRIRSNNTLEAFYILTPHIMEKIKQLKEKIKCYLIMYFEDSKLHIGLGGYKNLFEPNVNEEIDIEKFKDAILKDLSVVFELVETLDLDNDLFKK